MLRKLLLWATLSFAVSGYADLPDYLDMPAEQTPRSLHALYVDLALAGDRIVAVGEYGKILFSDDQGVSWQQAQVPMQSSLTAVDFPSASHGWAVGHDGVILHTADAGKTWTLQLSGRETGAILQAAAQARIAELEAAIAEAEAAGEATDDLSMDLDNAMMSLDEADREAEIGPNRPFMDVVFKNELEGYAVGAFGYYFVTTDGGKTWNDRSVFMPNPEFLSYYSIEQLSDDVMIIAGEFGLLLRSEDGGETWGQVELGYEGTLFACAAGPQTGQAVIAGLRGSFFFSSDLGASWQRVTTNSEASLIGVTAKDGQVTAAGTAATILTGKPAEGYLAPVPMKTRSHMAAVLPQGELFVIAGEGGVKRLTKDGEVLEASYIAGASE